jgi:hypothetical protein
MPFDTLLKGHIPVSFFGHKNIGLPMKKQKGNVLRVRSWSAKEIAKMILVEKA